MKTEILKINVAQRILSISDKHLLQKIQNLLDKENVFAYDAKGNPISENEYIKGLDQINNEIDNGTAKLYSSSEVIRQISNDNKLAL